MKDISAEGFRQPPNNGRASWRDLMAQAAAAQQAGDADAALALARVARTKAPAEAAPFFLVCILLLERQDAEANVLLPSLERFPGYAPGWERLGHTLLAMRPDAARIAFARAAQGYAATEAATADANAAYRLGNMLRQLGDLENARGAMQRATLRDPALAEAWFALGLLQQDLGDTQAAIQAFAAAFAARPSYHEAAFNLGVAHQEVGAMEPALTAYAQAWRLRPDSLGRIAQALVSSQVGRLWLHPSALQRELAARA